MKYFGRHRTINDRIDKEPYLERYYIFLKDRIKKEKSELEKKIKN